MFCMLILYSAIAYVLYVDSLLSDSLRVVYTVLQIPEENCVLVVMKAVELWEASGRPLHPSPSPHRHSND